MRGQCVDGGIPACNVVAILAAILVRIGGELALVRVLVARGADSERHAVGGLPAFWQMTLRARDFGMFSQERISGFDVVRDGEMGRLPSNFVVTGFAIAAIFAMRKLPAVLVLVAIQTARERDMRFEILRLVTVLAGHRRVLAEQRIVRAAMIEPVGRKNLLPSAGDMASRAIAAEGISVRILVARCTVVKRHEALIWDGRFRAHGRRTVALIAIQFGVKAGEWIARAFMRKAGRIFPGIL